MPAKIELTAHVLSAIRAMHRRAYHAAPSAEEEAKYVAMVHDSLLAFEKRYKGIGFFAASPIHSFEGVSIGAAGDRYPRHTLALTFVRRGKNDYLVATADEMPVGRAYAHQRLIEESSHINRNLPDLPARPKKT